MAEYEKYAVKQDNLDEEIVSASDNTQDRKGNLDTIPERFKDKSAQEVATSYTELEKAYSRQGQDLGDMRKTLDEYILLQSQAGAQDTNTQAPTQVDPVSIDDLYEDTEGSIRRVVTEETDNRISQLENALAQEKLDGSLRGFDKDFPGWREQVSTPEYTNWLQAAPYRVKMAQLAGESQDMSAAQGLLEMWYENTSQSNAQAQQENRTALQNAGLESSGATGVELDNTFSRSELMQKRIAAKQGDPTAANWLSSNQEAIAIAYEEGHITD